MESTKCSVALQHVGRVYNPFLLQQMNGSMHFQELGAKCQYLLLLILIGWITYLVIFQIKID